MKDLLDKHEVSWLGAVEPLLDPRRRWWSRGFLEGCALHRNAADPVPWALGHPVWRTLRTLEMFGSPQPLDAQLLILRQPELANLRSLFAYQSCLKPLTTEPNGLRITELAVAPAGPPLFDLIAVLPAACFARIRRLHVFGCSPELGCNFARPDLTLIAVVAPNTLAHWIERLTARNATFEEVRLVSSVFPLMARRGVELVLRPIDGSWSGLEIRWSDDNEPRLRDTVIEALDRLPENVLSQVSFVGPATARFDVPRWKQRLRATLVMRQPGIEIS